MYSIALCMLQVYKTEINDEQPKTEANLFSKNSYLIYWLQNISFSILLHLVFILEIALIWTVKLEWSWRPNMSERVICSEDKSVTCDVICKCIWKWLYIVRAWIWAIPNCDQIFIWIKYSFEFKFCVWYSIQ